MSTTKPTLAVEMRRTEALIPYAMNAKVHTPEQIAAIAACIREFHFCNPVLIDPEGGIIAGHGRVLAARKLALEEVPTITLGHLTDAQRRAYIIADNRLGEIGGGWDRELLETELESLSAEEIDLELVGFEIGNLDIALGPLDGLAPEASAEPESGTDPESGTAPPENYSRKIEAPIYEPHADRAPPVTDLFDRTRALALLERIDAVADELEPELVDFLRCAAERHTRFNFRNIAEFYAHADADVQALMEDSALVIIDFDRAVELGFVKLSEEVLRLRAESDELAENKDDDGEEDDERLAA